MIGRIHGKLIEKHPPQILVDVQGVGYELDVPMSTFYHLPVAGAEVALADATGRVIVTGAAAERRLTAAVTPVRADVDDLGGRLDLDAFVDVLECADVVVCGSGALLLSPLLGPRSRYGGRNGATHDSQHGKLQQRFQTAYPVVMLKRRLSDMGYAVLKEQPDRGKKDTVCLHGQWIGIPRNEAWRCSDHALFDLVATQGRAPNPCG